MPFFVEIISIQTNSFGDLGETDRDTEIYPKISNCYSSTEKLPNLRTGLRRVKSMTSKKKNHWKASLNSEKLVIAQS
jgi:hypothetical protein